MARQGDAEPSGPTGTSNDLHIKQFHMSEGHLDIFIMQGIERHRPSVTIAQKSGSGCRPPNGRGLASHLLRCRPARAGLRPGTVLLMKSWRRAASGLHGFA
jgi:hypothetical protein